MRSLTAPLVSTMRAVPALPPRRSLPPTGGQDLPLQVFVLIWLLEASARFAPGRPPIRPRATSAEAPPDLPSARPRPGKYAFTARTPMMSRAWRVGSCPPGSAGGEDAADLGVLVADGEAHH